MLRRPGAAVADVETIVELAVHRSRRRLDPGRPDGTPFQAWVLWQADAESRDSIAQEGARLNDLCRVSP